MQSRALSFESHQGPSIRVRARRGPLRADRRGPRRGVRGPDEADPGAFRRSSVRWRPTRSRSTAAAPACSTPTWRRLEDRWVDERSAPGLDPGRPARREFRHLPGQRRVACLRRQRLRRGLSRALHLGPEAVRREPGLARLAEGTAGRATSRDDRTYAARLSRPGPRYFVDTEDDDEWALTWTPPPVRCSTPC